MYYFYWIVCLGTSLLHSITYPKLLTYVVCVLAMMVQFAYLVPESSQSERRRHDRWLLQWSHKSFMQQQYYGGRFDVEILRDDDSE